jgi:hypothetical protein
LATHRNARVESLDEPVLLAEPSILPVAGNRDPRHWLTVGCSIGDSLSSLTGAWLLCLIAIAGSGGRRDRTADAGPDQNYFDFAIILGKDAPLHVTSPSTIHRF